MIKPIVVSTSKEASPQVEDFLEQWFHHFNIHFVKNVTSKNVSNAIDYYLPEQKLVVLIPNWKRPIAVSVVNTAVIIYNKLQLERVIIVASKVSEFAIETVQRIKYPIQIIDEYALTDLLDYIQPKKLTLQQLA